MLRRAPNLQHNGIKEIINDYKMSTILSTTIYPDKVNDHKSWGRIVGFRSRKFCTPSRVSNELVHDLTILGPPQKHIGLVKSYLQHLQAMVLFTYT